MQNSYLEVKKSYSSIISYFKKEDYYIYSKNALKRIIPDILRYEKNIKVLEELVKEFEKNNNEKLEDDILLVKKFLEKKKEDKIEDSIKKIKEYPGYKELELELESEKGVHHEVVEYDLYNSKEVREEKKKKLKN